MKQERKVLNNGSGFLTGLILVCILCVTGLTVAGYDYFKILQDRQKLVEAKINHTMDKNLSEGMEKIEQKIIQQPEQLEKDELWRDELDRVREENQTNNERTAYEVLNRLNLKEGLAQDTLYGMQLQLEELKKDTADDEHISALEDTLNGLQKGTLTEFRVWLEKLDQMLQDINNQLTHTDKSNEKEFKLIQNQIQELKTITDQYLTELAEQKNLTEVYQTQNNQHFEQLDAKIADLELQILVGLDALGAALLQYYTKEEVDTMLEDLNLDGINGRIDSLSERIDDCFQSVSDGKKELASAITDKGIDADADESFQNLAGKIRMITNTALVGDIKYTYHSHQSDCNGPCAGTVSKGGQHPDYTHGGMISDFYCNRCGAHYEHGANEHGVPDPDPYSCPRIVNKCGKGEKTIEKAEIVFE